jgi:hypothetical protein
VSLGALLTDWSECRGGYWWGDVDAADSVDGQALSQQVLVGELHQRVYALCSKLLLRNSFNSPYGNFWCATTML